MFIKSIKRLLFLSLFITGLNGNSIAVKQNNPVIQEKNSAILKQLIEDTATQSPWKIISNVKSEFVDKKIEDAENLDLYKEVTNALNHAVELKQFLTLFIPSLVKELKSEKFNNSTLSKIDEALNNDLQVEDLILLQNLSKNQFIGKKLGYAVSNIVLMWVYDIVKHMLENKSESNPELKEKNNKYIKILDIITKKTEEQIDLLVPQLPQKAANKKMVEILLKAMRFEKMIVEPAAKKIIELNVKQKNLAMQLVFKGFLKGKQDSELTQHMMDVTSEYFQKTFTDLEIKELIKIFSSNLFKNLTTVKNDKSGNIALMHIIYSYADQAKDYYESKVN